MAADEGASRAIYEQLEPGDRVEVTHDVTVGSSGAWKTATV